MHTLSYCAISVSMEIRMLPIYASGLVKTSRNFDTGGQSGAFGTA